MQNSLEYKTNFLFYKKYHKNKYNILVHIFCIPSIVWSTFCIVNCIGYMNGLDQESNLKYTPSILVYGSYMGYYYTIASSELFWQTFHFYLMILISANINYSYNSSKIMYYLIIQILSWKLQILSHRYFEGNSPALLSGISQSLLTAPIFIVDEIFQYTPWIKFDLVGMIYRLYLCHNKCN